MKTEIEIRERIKALQVEKQQAKETRNNAREKPNYDAMQEKYFQERILMLNSKIDVLKWATL